ncbi:MAG: PEGA domain-containing protein [bacterium]
MRLLIFVATLTFVIGGTILMIRYAQGYRPTTTGTIKGTGLLSANSFPTAGEVYINDKLTTATDNTLNLDPGEYQVTIKKDGYHSWSKLLTITAELVTATNAQLFPATPELVPLTYTGSQNTVPSPDGTKLAFTVASASAMTKNGLYIQDLNSSPISLNKTARQIARSDLNFDYTTSHYTWSPNGSELLVAFSPVSPSGGSSAHILLDTTRFNDLTVLKDVTVRLPQILSEWELELAREERVQLLKLPDFMAGVATTSATNLYFSPDADRLLYQATSAFTLPDGLVPALPSSSTQIQSRSTEPGFWYVYDLKEDKNFLISEGSLPKPCTSSAKAPEKCPETRSGLRGPIKLMLLSNFQVPLPAELISSPSAFRTLQKNVTPVESIALFNAQYSPIFVGGIQWYPDSSHLLLGTSTGIEIMEYDGTNRVTIYGGPMDPSIIYPWPDGSKIITKIAFSDGALPNLYTIKLK